MIVLVSIFTCDTQEPMTGDVGKEIGLPYCHRLVDVQLILHLWQIVMTSCISHVRSSWLMFTSRPRSFYNTSSTYNKINMQGGRYKETHVITIRKLPKLSMPQTKLPCIIFFTFTTIHIPWSKTFMSNTKYKQYCLHV